MVKLLTRKDAREKFTEEQTRKLFIQVRSKVNTLEEIEQEIRKIYDSSLELLSDEDSRGILVFGESSSIPI